MSDAFAGAWAVREYVFDARGNALGTVAQRRRVSSHGERATVVQDCEPDPSLIEHPMQGFAGHHEFALVRDGNLRRYLGPAVVGSAVAYGTAAMIGAGVWPGFGYDFTSWSISLSPDRQLTGGCFGRAGRTMAVIVGVGQAEGASARGPRLEGATDPRAVARHWRGTARGFDGAGTAVAEIAATRAYGAGGFREGGTGWDLGFEDDLGFTGSDGEHTIVGFARRYGWATRYQAALVGGAIVDAIEVVDPGAGRLVGYRRYRDGEHVTRVEILHLSPDEENHDE